MTRFEVELREWILSFWETRKNEKDTQSDENSSDPVDDKGPPPSTPTEYTFEVGGECTLHRPGKHGTNKLGDVEETHTKRHFVRQVPCADKGKVTRPSATFKESNEEAEAVDLTSIGSSR